MQSAPLSYNMAYYISRPSHTYSDSFHTDCSEWFVELWLDNFHIAKRSIWDERERKQGRRTKPYRYFTDDDLPIIYEATIPRAAITGVEVRENLVERYGTNYKMGSIYITVTEDAADPRELEPLKAVEFPMLDKGCYTDVGELVDAKGTIDAYTKRPTGDATKICVFQEIFACNPGDYWLSHKEDNALYSGFQEIANALNWSMGRDVSGIWQLG